MKPDFNEDLRPPQTVKPKKKGEKATSLYENIILGKKKDSSKEKQEGNLKQEKLIHEEINE